MKKYKEYMDRVEVSDTLHARLLALEGAEPRKQKPVWRRYAALAAALALVVGVGAYAIATAGGEGEMGGLLENFRPNAAIGENAPDIAIEPAPVPSVDISPMPSLGGYEVSDGDGENGAVAYFFLPYIEYGQVAAAASADWAAPPGVERRDLTEKELLALWGGEQILSGHLDWGGYEVTAFALVYEDGSLWALFVNGHKGPMEHFGFALTPGSLPPACIVYEESVVNDLWGVEVTADGFVGQDGGTRRITFMDQGIGYRFEITGADVDEIDLLVSRLARWVIMEGVDLSLFGLGEEPVMEGAEPVPTPSGDGASTPAYDPAASRPPAQSSTAPSASEPPSGG